MPQILIGIGVLSLVGAVGYAIVHEGNAVADSTNQAVQTTAAATGTGIEIIAAGAAVGLIYYAAHKI
jgi:hypothetical protein